MDEGGAVGALVALADVAGGAFGPAQATDTTSIDAVTTLRIIAVKYTLRSQLSSVRVIVTAVVWPSLDSKPMGIEHFGGRPPIERVQSIGERII